MKENKIEGEFHSSTLAAAILVSRDRSLKEKNIHIKLKRAKSGYREAFTVPGEINIDTTLTYEGITDLSEFWRMVEERKVNPTRCQRMLRSSLKLIY